MNYTFSVAFRIIFKIWWLIDVLKFMRAFRDIYFSGDRCALLYDMLMYSFTFEKILAEHPFRNRDSRQHYIWQSRVISFAIRISVYEYKGVPQKSILTSVFTLYKKTGKIINKNNKSHTSIHSVFQITIIVIIIGHMRCCSVASPSTYRLRAFEL